MKKSRFTESQIVSAIKQHESGLKTDEICRDYGISKATFHQWRKKYAGMDSLQLKRLTELQKKRKSNPKRKIKRVKLKPSRLQIKSLMSKTNRVDLEGVSPELKSNRMNPEEFQKVVQEVFGSYIDPKLLKL